MNEPNFKYELKCSKTNFLIAGVDEVGRGALAGPIVAGAVIFHEYENIIQELKEVKDSKVLTHGKRMELDDLVKSKAHDFSIGVVSVEEIDHYGIGAANVTAFQRALKGLKKCDFALIDGRKFRGFDYKYLCLEKGESKSLSIAAASIIAKVYRDNLMEKLLKDDIYHFAENKGYGCKNHYEALEKYGPSIHHRKTFLKKFDNTKNQISLF